MVFVRFIMLLPTQRLHTHKITVLCKYILFLSHLSLGKTKSNVWADTCCSTRQILNPNIICSPGMWNSNVNFASNCDVQLLDFRY